jgi:bla regulator protein blaR1
MKTVSSLISSNPALVDHLWQTTAFTLLAALLAFVLRNNSASIRFTIWWFASLKFLMPLSLLIGVGHAMHRQTAPLDTPSILSFVVDGVAPFSASHDARLALPSEVGTAPTEQSILARSNETNGLARCLLAIWIAGMLAILWRWYAQRRHLLLVVNSSQLVTTIRGIRVLSSEDSMELGAFGIFDPVLLLPLGIKDNLTEAQYESVIAHELSHVRRRDNLFAALHMLITAAFWFHPFVWWIGSRLEAERERACDETVLLETSKPEIYAEAILNVCRFYTNPPADCMSGVAGADLRQRIRRIMSGESTRRIDVRQKMILGMAATLVLVLPVFFGLIRSTDADAQGTEVMARQAISENSQKAAGGQIAFEVASVKQNKMEVSQSSPYTNFSVRGDAPHGNHLVTRNLPLIFYIQLAYKSMTPSQINAILKQLPDWAKNERFDIEARAEGEPTKDQVRLMVQSLLADRFGWAMHFEDRQVPVLAMTLVKPGITGHKLRPHSEGPPCDVPSQSPDSAKKDPSPVWPPVCHTMIVRPVPGKGIEAGFRDATMGQLAANLTFMNSSGRPVVDRTDLGGSFDLILQWTPEPGSPMLPPDATISPEVEVTTLDEGLKEQLGLKLDATSAPMQMPVVDHVERPSKN